MTTITDLSLENCGLTTVPASLDGLINLTSLNLWGNPDLNGKLPEKLLEKYNNNSLRVDIESDSDFVPDGILLKITPGYISTFSAAGDTCRLTVESNTDWVVEISEGDSAALLEECIDGLNIQPGGTYVDVTFGGGGHSRAILGHLGECGRLFSLDQDEDARQNSLDDPRFTFVHSNFRFLKNFMRYYGVERVDGILADLGVSFHHFDDSDRGFSFRFEGPLDMRMNRRSGQTAAQLIATCSEEKLADLFFLYGELKSARRIAAAVVAARSSAPIETTERLLEVVRPYINRKQEKKELAQLFQALRIEVNQEMESLRRLLEQSVELLPQGGRLVVLTYHSLEDRMVKNFMKTGNVEGRAEQDFFGRINAPLRPVNNKVIVPDEAEIERNPRSRSAKLRIAEKV